MPQNQPQIDSDAEEIQVRIPLKPILKHNNSQAIELQQDFSSKSIMGIDRIIFGGGDNYVFQKKLIIYFHKF